MNLSISDLVKGAVATLRDPQEGARLILAIDMERRQRWDILGLIAVLSAGFAYISVTMGSGISDLPTTGMAGLNPIMLAISQLVVLLVMVFAMHIIGRAFGGKGSLDGAILLVAWLQFILICLQVLQIAATLIMPFVAVLIGMAGLVVVFWLLSAFVCELHGFRSRFRVFVAILVVIVALTSVLTFVFDMLGIDVTGVL